MLHTLTDDGNVGWRCVGCGAQRTAQANAVELRTHPDGQRTALLPVCDCGAQTGLKVDFTEEELRAPNMIHPVTGAATPSRAAAERHMALAKRLEEG